MVSYHNTGYNMLDVVMNKASITQDIKWFEHLSYKDIMKSTSNVTNIAVKPSSTDEINENPMILTEICEDGVEYPIQYETTEDDWRMLVDHTYGFACLTLSANHFNRHEQQLSSDLPRLYHRAIQSRFKDKWGEAIEREFQSLKENDTWIIESRGNEQNLMNTKWVFSIKINPLGEEMAKARLVVGCADKNKYDDEEKYSPVCPVDIIHLVLSVAQVYKLSICLLYTSPSPRDRTRSRMPSSA